MRLRRNHFSRVVADYWEKISFQKVLFSDDLREPPFFISRTVAFRSMGLTAIYVRVSTTKQSNDRQLEACQKEVKGDHEVYADIGSGSKPDRDDIQRLIDDIEAGKVDRVVSWEISRIGRKLSFVSQFIDLCTEEGVELDTVNDMFPGIRPGNDIFDNMINQLMAWMMEFEREMIRERVQSGVNKAINEGKWVGRPPYGFTTNDDGYLQMKSEDYLAMQQAVERVVLTDESVNSTAITFDVPASSLHTIVNDEEKVELYLSGEHDDIRLARAVDGEDSKSAGELNQIKERLNELEDSIQESS